MPDVSSQLAVDNRNVRHHGLQIMAIADYSAAVPTEFFASDGTLNALPAGYKNMGYITTAGIKVGTAITESTDTMVQDIEPVRSSMSALTRTLVVSFGESNAWTQGLAAGARVADWPSDKNVSWSYDFGSGNDFPYYRIMILTQDNSGPDAVYRVEFAYRAKATALADRTLDRTTVEEINPTFTCFRDPVVGKSYTIESTPSTGPVSTAAPTITSITPADAGTGATVTIDGSGFTGVTAAEVLFGGTAATSVTVVSDTELTAVVPSGTAGAVNVTVQNANGTSAPFSYARAA